MSDRSVEYPYPAETPGATDKLGIYWHSLGTESREALDHVIQWTEEEGIRSADLCLTDMHPNYIYLRYLRANKFDVEKTKEQILKNVTWRREMNIPAIMQQTPEQILGCDLQALMSVFPHWHYGYDKTGRPVLYKQYGKFDAAKVKKLAGDSFDRVVRYHIWEQETAGRLCAAASHGRSEVVETITGVVDLKDMGLSQITRDFLNLTKALAEVDQHQYPETMGRTFIINAPSAFPIVWRVVKPWLDPATTEKIHIYGAAKVFIPVLQDFIGEENLPQNYGGSLLPPLNPSVHPYAEAMQRYYSTADTAALTTNESRGGAVDITEDSSVIAVNNNSRTINYEQTLEFTYPANTPGADSDSGHYWQNLSDESRAALRQLQQWVQSDAIPLRQLTRTKMHPTFVLLRYLRANKFDVQKTQQHMLNNIEWRNAMNVTALMKQTPDEILGCEVAAIAEVFPHWHHGYDKTGRPVLYKQYGKFDAAKVKKLAGDSFDRVVRYHLWEQEIAAYLCEQMSYKRSEVVETITGVVDLKGMGLSQITRDFLNLTKALAEIDQNQFPETLGRIFVINAPAAFPIVWRVVKPWLDPATTEKIKVFGGPSQYVPALQEFIGEENLPQNYGGSLLPPLNPSVHPYTEVMKAWIEGTGLEVEPEFGVEGRDYVPLRNVNSLRLGSNAAAEEHKSSSQQQQRRGIVPGVADLSTSRRYNSASVRALPSSNIAATAADNGNGESSGGGGVTDWLSSYFTAAVGWWYSDETAATTTAAAVDGQVNINSDAVNADRTSNGSPGGSDDGLTYEEAYQSQADLESQVGNVQQQQHGVGDSSGNNSKLHQLPGRGRYPFSRLLRWGRNNGELDAEETTAAKTAEARGCDLQQHCICRAMILVYHCCTWDQHMKKMSINKVEFRLLVSMSAHFVAAIAAIVISSLALQDIEYSSAVAIVQLWAAVVVALVSSLMLLVHIVGFFGVRWRNWALLLMYATCLAAGTLVFALVTTASFLYYAVPQFTGLGDAALNSAFDDDASRSNARRLLREYNLILAVGCLIATVFGWVPLVYARGLIILLRRATGRKLHTYQLQLVLRIAQSISFCAATVMLIYGGYCTHFLLQLRYTAALFPVYGLIYCGIAVLISSTFGLWVSYTVHRSVLRLYKYCVLPALVTVLIVNALISFSSLYKTDQQVHRQYDEMSTDQDEDDLKVIVQTFLLVSGIFCTILCSFQIISLVSTISLYEHIDSSNERLEILHAMQEKEMALGLGHFTNSAMNDAALSAAVAGGSNGNYINRYGYGTIANAATETNITATGTGTGTGTADHYEQKHHSYRSANTTTSISRHALMGDVTTPAAADFWSKFSVDTLSRLYMIEHRGRQDQLLIIWAIIMGLWNLFVLGTFVIFGRYITVSHLRSHWMFALWRFCGTFDSRFVSADPFLLGSCALLAVVIGPLLLFYAWSSFVLAPYRHVLGAVLCILHVYSWMIYYISAAYGDYRAFNQHRPGLIFAWTVLSLLLYVLLPALVFQREALTATNDTSSSDSQELLLDYSDEQAKLRLAQDASRATDSNSAANAAALQSVGCYQPPTPGTRSTAAIDISEHEDITVAAGNSQSGSSERSAALAIGLSLSNKSQQQQQPQQQQQRGVHGNFTPLSSHSSPHSSPYVYVHSSGYKYGGEAFTPRTLPTLREEELRGDNSTEWASVYSEKRRTDDIMELEDSVAHWQQQQQQEQQPQQQQQLQHNINDNSSGGGFSRVRRWLNRRRGQAIIRNQQRPRSFGSRSKAAAASAGRSSFSRQSSTNSALITTSQLQQQDHLQQQQQQISTSAATFALVNAATDAMSVDPYRMLTTLRRLGVSSVDAKAMVSYLVRSKRHKADNSLAMVV